VLVEDPVDADKSISEKALAVLDAVLASEEGRASTRAHTLAVPMLVKKMFCVSDLATHLAMLAMWQLGKAHSDGVENDAVTRVVHCRGAVGWGVPEAAPALAGRLHGRRNQGEGHRAAQDAQQVQERRRVG
jgi:hypothetical protein